MKKKGEEPEEETSIFFYRMRFFLTFYLHRY